MALVGAVVLGLALVTHQRRVAYRALGDELQRTAVGRALREIHTRDLGYDLASLLDVDHVPFAQVEGGDLVGVVERGTLYDCPGQKYRLEVGDGGYGSRAPYLIGNL